ncbi:hypothetical protein [Pseudonocardia spinosispora]|uniref:hypothetical protein n=1 Tax=Pseudonocardia spinosispora TaxID=103441 RepID=UPI0003F5B3DC|nr:hypothetical protein [Pseudonocardia spinosispora]
MTPGRYLNQLRDSCDWVRPTGMSDDDWAQLHAGEPAERFSQWSETDFHLDELDRAYLGSSRIWQRHIDLRTKRQGSGQRQGRGARRRAGRAARGAARRPAAAVRYSQSL